MIPHWLVAWLWFAAPLAFLCWFLLGLWVAVSVASVLRDEARYEDEWSCE